MIMSKKGQGGMSLEMIVGLIILGLAAIGFLLFYSGFFGKAGSALNANDPDVIAAAAGCSTDLVYGSPDLQKKFCKDFKTIEKKSLLGSILGTSKQLVNCQYLNNTIGASISGAEEYAAITCPSNTWADKCSLILSENVDSSDYSILINGKMCSKKDLNNAYASNSDYNLVPLAAVEYDKSNDCASVPVGTYTLKSVPVVNNTGVRILVDSKKVYYIDQAKCRADPNLGTLS